MKILIAGPGCARCRTTEKIVKDVCSELKLNADISHLYDFKEYLQYGVRITPAIIIDEKVVLSGKVPSPDEVKEIILKFHNQ